MSSALSDNIQPPAISRAGNLAGVETFVTISIRIFVNKFRYITFELILLLILSRDISS